MHKDQLRQRGGGVYPSSSPLPTTIKPPPTAKHGAKSSPPAAISFHHLAAAFAFAACCMACVVIVERKLPPDLRVVDEPLHPHRFVAERAMRHLVALTDLGPRVSGSRENELLAVGLLSREIAEIVARAKDHHVIRTDVQKASGSFPLTFLDGLTSVYRSVSSVVVRIGSRIESQHSLLLNCHYDTVPDSPGASDDGAGCAVMLEILRVISQSPRLLKHNIIFLFNGAEENLMQASHGFITQHKWAKEVRAFINLEACGAGGRELLFQAGPNNPWILDIYAQSVPYPYASSLAQEIFESGVIPGETDFRIFRDFGKISGLDFAWSTNGYVYHTKFDKVNQIPLGTLQRTGDNILALALGISNGYHLAQSQSNEGQPVFFDFLGAFVVRVPIPIAGLICLISISMMIGNIYLNIATAKRKAFINPKEYMSSLQSACVHLAMSWVVSLLSCVGLATLLTGVGRAMSWYARPFWLYTLYVLQVVFVPAVCLLLATKKKRTSFNFSGWTLVQLYLDAFSLLWASLLLICMLFQIRSGFLVLLWVLCPSLVGLVRHSLFSHWSDWRRLVLYVLGIFLPFVESYYFVIGAVYMFIPIMGRLGSSIFPEVIVAILMACFFVLVLGWIGPLFLGAEYPWKLVKWIVGVTLVSVALVILTPLGFPYSGNPAKPAPQRFMIAHTDRRFVNADGNVTSRSSGFWIVDLDTHSPHSVDGYVPSMRSAIEVGPAQCDAQLYCGMPYLLPVQSLISHTHWLEVSPPPLPFATRMQLTGRETVNSTVERFHFKVTGPDHIGLMISPVAGASLKSWSFLAGQPPLAGPRWSNDTRETYFVYLAAGADYEIPWHFHLDVAHSFERDPGRWLDIVVVGHFLHGEHKSNAVLDSFVGKFPVWTAVSFWSTDMVYYVF